MDSPLIVIKVKYGKTLRRFRALVKEDQRLQLNMEELRAKICSLFSFPPGANFRLTYIDEDNDRVTLADNEDLHDVVIQGLNPVRVTVHLDSSAGAFSGIQSGGNSTSSRSSAQNFQNIDPAVADVLKSSKLSRELAPEAVSANPVVSNISKPIQASPGGMTRNGILSTQPSSRTQAPKVAEMSKGTESMTSPVPPYFFFQKGKDTKTQCSAGITGYNNDVDLGAFNGKHEKDVVAVSKYSPISLDPSKGRLERREDASRYYKDPKYGRISSPSTFGSSHLGVPSVYRPDERHFGHKPFDGNFYNADVMGSIIHQGICCDGCGVLPITGPRFKSKVKYDYDLCNICFTRMGNYYDYTRIDFPSPKRSMFKGFHDAPSPHSNRILPSASARFNQLSLRLDSRVIKDVGIMGGTIMAPSTPFTKIWRMRNSGTLPWSHGLQLLWIGGDRFSSHDSVKIEIPANGVDVGKEVDISVDCTAPESPGQYISIWSVAESSGHVFGQRLSVEIQVDASLKEDDSTRESSVNSYFKPLIENTADPNSVVKAETPTEDQKQKSYKVNLNLHPINDESDSEVSCASSTSSTSSLASTFVSSPVSQSVTDRDLQSPSALPLDSNPKDSSADSSEIEDKNREREEDDPEEQNEEKNGVEELLSKELEEMGFGQKIDLNKEVLRGNENDLEKSVDGLGDFSEWDPILEELQEMGFHDKVTNKKLLQKNNGSIMRVVMDLVSGDDA